MNKKILIAVVLLLSWLVFSAVYFYSKSNITVVQEFYTDSALTHSIYSEILKSEKVTGDFKASENYLGQVLVRFYNYDRINSDSVIFRIKEKNSSDWLYQNIYKTDQFIPNALFTFGFPIIPDSRGKEYYFEIESVAGIPEDAITLSPQKPTIGVIYQFPKKELIKNTSVLGEFLSSKLKYTQINRDLLINFITYLDFIMLLTVIEFVFLKELLKLKLKHAIYVYFLALGLLLLISSLILFSIKKNNYAETLIIVSYFLLSLGIFTLLLTIKNRKS